MKSIPSTKASRQDQQTAEEKDPVIFEGDRAAGFTQVYNAIVRDSTLSNGAKACFTSLLSYCWGKHTCFPGQERLAADLGKSPRTIRRYLTELKQKKRIRIERRGMGKTNIYFLAIPTDRTKPATPERTKPASIDRPKMTAKKDQPKHTQAEPDEALSNSSKGTVESVPACSHIARATIRNTDEALASPPIEADRKPAETSTPLPPAEQSTSNTELPPVKERPARLLASGMSSTAEVIGKGTGAPRHVRTPEPPRLAAPPLTQADMDKRIRERLAREQQASLLANVPAEHIQELNRQFGTGAQPPAIRSKRQPVPERLQLSLERISEELGDWQHVTSNITQAENIRREAGVPLEQFIEQLFDARAATRHAAQTGKINKRNTDGQLLKMPYFFSCLRKKLGLSKRVQNKTVL